MDSDPSKALLLARADAGWRNWQGVLDELDGAEWLDEMEGGEGRLLLAQGLEAVERWEEAVENYRRFRSVEPPLKGAAPWVASREARAAARAGLWEPVLTALEATGRESPVVASWTVLALARLAAEMGNTDRVLELVPVMKSDPITRQLAWDMEGRAWLASGDSARAMEVYLELVQGELTAARRGEVMMVVGGLYGALADSVAAHVAYKRSFDVYPRGTSGARAAWGILQFTGDTDAAQALRLAKTLDKLQDPSHALRAYEIYMDALPQGTTADVDARLAWARLISTFGRHEDAVREFRELVRTDNPDFELRVLDQWLRTRTRQGRRDAVQTIQGWIIDRFPESRQAVDILVARANSALSRGAYEEAATGFARVAGMGVSHSSAGLARMRLGQIYLQRNDEQAAAEVFKSYFEDFPNGQRWDQAAYWAAHSLSVLGQDAEAIQYIESIQERNALSYYGVLASDLLDEPFQPSLPRGSETSPPSWLKDGLQDLDLIVAAGLDEGVEVTVDRLIVRADGSVSTSLDLAEALIKRGFTIEGINLGWKLLRQGTPQSKRLLRVLYPFPYREIVTREAEEKGIDPIILAALIRQESAFTPAIRSPAGAIGLMQVMPETGRELARGEGIRGFMPSSLETAEINLHLGTNFWVEMESRYGDGSLPLVLSAYNAGPTRARRWRQLPEAKDPLRFTERIPFNETRGYVKNIIRNIRVYRFLYDSR
ncbi:MAG: transglycosylase SLT domain-containing protein [Gemmatimonadota bacterium]|nr:transglycosylase SLT domain-containing protein [Gemmatimonadota bacterium]